MTVPIIVTRGDSPMLRHCLDSLAATKPLPYAIVVVCNQDEDNARVAREYVPHLPLWVYSYKDNLGFWGAQNAVLPDIPDNQPICYFGKDVIFHKDWLAKAEGYWRQFVPDGLGLLTFWDGLQNGDNASHGMTTKRWMQVVWGTPYYPAPPYFHFFLDVELTWRSRDLGRYFYDAESKVEHRHAQTGFNDWPDTLRIYAEDHKLFDARRIEWQLREFHAAKLRLDQAQKGGEASC